jgi:hypothetical protein
MKVALTCDYLISRNHYSEIMEILCEIFPEAMIYTFAHREGAILGRVEQRRISSSYLSKEVSTEEEFYGHSSKIPLLAKNMFVSCEYDLIINVSRGLSHGIKKCDKSKQITYLYDIGFEGKVKKSFIQKLAYPWFLNFFVNSFKQADRVFVSRQDLKDDLARYIGDVEVVAPPFKITDYSLFPKDMFKHHFYLVESKGLSENEVKSLIGFFKKTNREFQFIGDDEHLESLKKSMESEMRPNTFFGNRCSGEHAPVLASSKMYISFNEIDFPKLSLAALACGRPVLIPSSQNVWIKGEGIYEMEKFNLEQLEKVLTRAESEIDSFEGPKLRSHVNQYHEVKFKAFIKRIAEKDFK